MNNKNNYGFTLVELLAMLVVLGLIMGVAIPNIVGILNRSKVNMMKEDSTKMVNSAKISVSSRELKKPNNNQCVMFSLDYLDNNDDIKKGPNDGEYLRYDSFVLMKKEGSKYVYYVRLIEKIKDNKYSGVELANYDLFVKSPTSYIENTNNILNFQGNESLQHISNKPLINSVCSGGVIAYYS